MKTIYLSTALLAALFATSASAQPMPPPHGPPGVPAAEELATVPDLTTTQQIEVRKVLLQRRDAQEAAHAKLRSEFDALRVRERGEHERIDAQASDQLRKLLGEDGYRKFAEWDMTHRGPHGGGGGPGQHPPMRPHGDHGNGPGREGAPPPADGGGAPHAPEAPGQ